MRKAGSSVVFLFTALILPLGVGTIRAATVAYKDLATTRLPYGEAIAISGNTKDFVINDSKLGKVNLVDWINVQKISAIVTVAGTTARAPVDATVNGTSWTVNIDQFPKNASVTFDFRVTGDLSGSQPQLLVSRLADDSDFQAAFGAFFAKGTKAESSAIAEAKGTFADAAAPVVKRLLPGFLAPNDVKTIADALKKSNIAEIGLLNVRNDLNSLIASMQAMRVTSLAGVSAGSSTSDAYAKLKDIKSAADVRAKATLEAGATLTNGQADALWQSIQAFDEDFSSAYANIGKGLVADISVSVNLTEITTVQDFAKYAGIDVGALYAPPVSSLRSFFTINIYLGAVEDTPAPVTKCAPEATPAIRARQIAEAEKKVEEAKAREQRMVAQLDRRQKDLAALQKATPNATDQIARETQGVNTAKRTADAATAERLREEQALADTLTPSSGKSRACTLLDSAVWQVFQQRFSLSGGISLGDVSGQQNPPFKSNYAFVVGAGWRINKYFRLFSGDLLYRNKTTDRMNHAFCFGVSVDVAALSNITSVFGKVK